jgi:hypothetical protein
MGYAFTCFIPLHIRPLKIESRTRTLVARVVRKLPMPSRKKINLQKVLASLYVVLHAMPSESAIHQSWIAV